MPLLSINFDSIENNLTQLQTETDYNELIGEINLNNNYCLNYAQIDLIKKITTKDEQSSQCVDVIDGKTDLIANEYEGGFKVWEGLHDMINYLDDSNILANYVDRWTDDSINILDLGCGSGLVSIFCHRILPNANIYLQDFNDYVLKYFTATNIVLNSDFIHKPFDLKFKYLFGDWSDTIKDIEQINVKFDLILTSETIYNESNYEKLLKLFKCGLSPNGVIYIACKTHYFGIGGGMYSFIEFIESDSQFECEVCTEIEASLVRYILKLEWKNQPK